MLDQCDHCGGVWFDRFELFQVSEAEARGLDQGSKAAVRGPGRAGKASVRGPGRAGEVQADALDQVDGESLHYPQGSSAKPLCPRCGISLKVFSDPNIPANIQMLICGSCEGFWINHGSISGYARYREAGRSRPDPKLAAQYEKMLQAQSDKQYWQGIENFGNAVGGGRDMLTGLSLSGSPAELDRIDRTQDAFFTMLGIAARLLFSWL